MGTLIVDVIEAHDLIAADDTGFSDPYCTLGPVSEEGKREKQKTKVITKSLDPVWNEQFTFDLESKREGFSLRLWDWDQFTVNDPLGTASIDVASLPDNTQQDLVLPLEGVEKGTLHIKALFKPDAPSATGAAKVLPLTEAERRVKEVALIKEENRKLRAAIADIAFNATSIPKLDGPYDRVALQREMTFAKRNHATVVVPPLKPFVWCNPVSGVDPSLLAPGSITMDWSAYPPVAMGKEMRRKHFLLHSGFLNASSYGALPKAVLEAINKWEILIQQNPFLFRMKTFPAQMQKVVAKVCDFIKADPQNFQFVLNANAATSSVLKSISWAPGDRIVVYNLDYEATHHACAWLKKYHAVETVEIHLSLPLTHEEILEQTEAELKKIVASGPLPKLFNFCHVTSRTAYIFPARELVALSHKYNIPVCVDGAQAPGHIPINVAEVNSDFYLGTLHKWCFASQGTAFLVVAPHMQRFMTPLTVSPYFGAGFLKEFGCFGNHDYALWCSLEQSFEFVERVCGGWDRVYEYGYALANECITMLEGQWHTRIFQKPGLFGRMPIIPLPNGIFVADPAVKQIMGRLALCNEITCFLVLIPIKGIPTVGIRISCQVFNDLSEVKKMAKAINEMNGNYSAINAIRHFASDALM
ncbi:aminotransferase class V-fold PLP-dependent enzyme [Pelomyxa schiedti]|nr:aminotransferase class V-fold PLP-dependent enzyme [Pelomyxa schiedti]